MRIAKADLMRVRQPQLFIKLHRILLRLDPLFKAVLQGRFGMLVDDLVGRVERGRRRLRHIGDPRAAQCAPLGFGRGGKLHPVELDRTVRDPRAIARIAHTGRPDRRFPGTGLTDKAHDLAAVQGQVDPLDDIDPAFIGVALDFQVPDFQKNVFFLYHIRLPFQARGAMKHPVDHKVDRNCQQGDGTRRNKRCDITERDQRRILAHH